MAPSYIVNQYPFLNNGLLYHYTSTESFFKILDSLKLRPSKFGTLNDLNEGGIFNYHNLDIFQKIEARQIVAEQCTLLSFTKSYEENGYCQSGTNRPSMWAHYANNSDGVCIVLHEDSFLKSNNSFIKKYWGKMEDVEYNWHNAYGDLTQGTSALDTIKKNYRKLFFLKHNDWKQENERRLLLIGLDPDLEMLDISNSIAYFAMGTKFWKNYDNIEHILARVSNPNHVCYRKFVPHTFAMMTYGEHGYWETDAAFKFYENKWLLKKKCVQQIEDYFSWLKREGC